MTDIRDPNFFNAMRQMQQLQFLLSQSDAACMEPGADPMADPYFQIDPGLEALTGPGAQQLPTSESAFAAYMSQLSDPQAQQWADRMNRSVVQQDAPQEDTGDPKDHTDGTQSYGGIDSDVYAGAWDGVTIRGPNGNPLLTDAHAAGLGFDTEAELGAHADADWAGFEAGVGGELKAEAKAGGWAAGTADLSQGDLAGALHGGAFAGAMAHGNGELGVRYAHADLDAGVGVGYGLDGGVHAGLDDWKLKAGFDLKLGFGPAFEISPDVEIDFKQIKDDVVDAGKAIGGAAKSAWNWLSGGDGGKPKDNSLD